MFVNPIAAARRAYPYVVALQFDLARDLREQIVAPAIPRHAASSVAGPLTPVVLIKTAEHVVLVPALAGLRTRDLGRPIDTVAAARADFLAAIDYLFFGV